MRNVSKSRQVGFTLVELLVVIAIIGILIALILVAAADGVRRAEERATQSLITKLETALNDRIDALLNSQPPINQTHRYLAAIYNSPNSSDRRASVFAQFDYMRAEIPDVFFLNSETTDGSTVSGSYPLNFAAAPYPPGSNLNGVINVTPQTATGVTTNSWVVPLGNTSPGLPKEPDSTGTYVYVPNSNSLYTPPPTSGMFGASFSAAGGIYKNLGYAPTGYDGVDNNKDGFVDEYNEGILGLSAADVQKIQTNLTNHTHKTARSEMLYAVLVEGLSPLGSSFSREDFTAREVRDTDGDGLPEFVDAWGEPLQFYRWPIYYGTVAGSSDSQLGSFPYNNYSSNRQQDPLDPNQLLMAPGWWASASNTSLTLPVVDTFTTPTLAYAASGGTTNQCSQGAMGFMNYFHVLVEPNFMPKNTTGKFWDRGASFNRRAFFSKFLIISGGPDREPGVAQFNKQYSDVANSPSNIYTFPIQDSMGKMDTMEHNAWSLIFIENQAAQSDPVGRTGLYYEIPNPVGSSLTTAFFENTAAGDDISNHNISTPSTGVR